MFVCFCVRLLAYVYVCVHVSAHAFVRALATRISKVERPDLASALSRHATLLRRACASFPLRSALLAASPCHVAAQPHFSSYLDDNIHVHHFGQSWLSQAVFGNCQLLPSDDFQI